jgi:hypothetical protein
MSGIRRVRGRRRSGCGSSVCSPVLFFFGTHLCEHALRRRAVRATDYNSISSICED